MAITTTCKSKAHENYRQAVEGLYIQTWMASRDLTALLQGINDGPLSANDAAQKGQTLLLQQHKLDEVTERIAFGKSELDKAQQDVDRHLASGRCQVFADRPEGTPRFFGRLTLCPGCGTEQRGMHYC
jgi:hypothetical protein